MKDTNLLRVTLPPIVLLAFFFALLSSYCQPIPEIQSKISYVNPYLPTFNLYCYLNSAGANEQPEVRFPWHTAIGRPFIPMTVITSGTIASGVSTSTTTTI